MSRNDTRDRFRDTSDHDGGHSGNRHSDNAYSGNKKRRYGGRRPFRGPRYHDYRYQPLALALN